MLSLSMGVHDTNKKVKLQGIVPNVPTLTTMRELSSEDPKEGVCFSRLWMRDIGIEIQ